MRLAVFLICSGIGYLLGRYLPDPLAAYVSILVSYHLFLAWLLITADHEAGFSFPILSTVVTHLACLALLIGLAMGQRYVPFLGLVRIFVPGLAPFECDWLFSGGRKKKDPSKLPEAAQAVATGTITTVAAAPATAEPEYTFDDHDEWRRYLAKPHRPFKKAGLSLGDEFKQWHAARAQSRATASENQNPD
ncbi:MAG TPA: hypothetical protein VGT08_03075 [Terracidiphilus sp.]|nr:hypothetical protein [Terracidiphilus sp.]